VKKIVLLGVVALLASATAALAQDQKQWGVIGSVVPSWNAADNLKVLFGTEDFAASAVDVHGSEFRIGVARGRELGGDWSLSFVRKRFNDDSVVNATEIGCVFNGFDCVDGEVGTIHTLQQTMVTGVEYQSFRPFVTIKNRAQIGVTWGIGVGKTEGTAVGLIKDFDGSIRPDVRPAKDIFPNVAGKPLPVTPLAQLELSAAGIVAPGLKVRLSGGFNFPGYEKVSLGVVYFFGRK
jgi:hypothetical protein